MTVIPIKPSDRLMQLLIGGVCLVLLLRDHTAGATIPTIDNIVKILQSPVVQQLILPRPLVAADTGFAGGEAADESASAKPEMQPSKDSKKPSKMDEEKHPSPASSKNGAAKAARDEATRPFLIPRTRALPGCPLCDASVYGYCDEKVYHDACCCGSINGAAPFGGGGGFGGGGFGGSGFGGGGFGGGGFGGGGFGGGGFGDDYGGFGGHGGGRGCGYQGCSYLFANSCYEHQLIVNCCCNSPY